ncbi:hypothetical protein [uncultured Thalassolituus sp.]|uniref:hypothetical protein n=1 Tax=uncultured Thalassolituus sp. TaxID=285273 RepID=UPI00262777CB|nr:hypothetical protein [uncultured Thalassolituus sp.]
MLKFIPSEVYAALSFRKGGRPDLERFETFFLPQAVFINNKGSEPVISSLQDFTSMIDSLISNEVLYSLRETEIEQTCQVFGKVAQINSAYELLAHTKDGITPRYGVNLFQFVQSGDRWLISAMCWDDRPDGTLLKQLPSGARLHPE